MDQTPRQRVRGNLDLLLVNPSHTNVYQDEQEAAAYPALEPPYLAGLTAEFVRNQGFGVDLLDANVRGLTTDQTAAEVAEHNPRLIHIIVHGNQPSASSQLMDWVTDTARKVKDSGIDTKILLTGTHPAALPELTLEERAFDYIGTGEAFYRIPFGLLQGRSLDEVPGLWFRENGDIAHVAPQGITSEELDVDLPRAAWDLMPPAKYRAHDWHCLDDLDERQPYAAIYTTFGCPFACDFCCINSTYDEGGYVKHRMLFRSPKKVADEIEFLVKEHGVRNLKIIDEMYVLNKGHYVGLSNELIRRGLGEALNMWDYARVDTIHGGTLDTLRRSGTRWIALGIESGSDHVRDGVEKGGRFGYDEIIANVRKVQDAGIHIVSNFIFGLPDDTEQTMQETLDLAIEINTERSNFYCTMAYPGSALHRQAQNTSRLLRSGNPSAVASYEGRSHSLTVLDKRQIPLPIPKDWNPNRALLPEEEEGPGWIGYSQHAHETYPLPTAYLHPEQVLAFRDQALPNFFGNPIYRGMLEQKFGKDAADRFIAVNAKSPSRRMILGHTKD